MTNDQAAAAEPAIEIRLADVQQQALEATRAAIQAERYDDAHCLASTYEALARAGTMTHEAVGSRVERELDKLAAARERDREACDGGLRDLLDELAKHHGRGSGVLDLVDMASSHTVPGYLPAFLPDGSPAMGAFAALTRGSGPQELRSLIEVGHRAAAGAREMA